MLSTVGVVGFLILYKSKCKFQLFWKAVIVGIMIGVIMCHNTHQALWIIGVAVNFFTELFALSLVIINEDPKNVTVSTTRNEGVVHDLE